SGGVIASSLGEFAGEKDVVYGLGGELQGCEEVFAGSAGVTGPVEAGQGTGRVGGGGRRAGGGGGRGGGGGGGLGRVCAAGGGRGCRCGGGGGGGGGEVAGGWGRRGWLCGSSLRLRWFGRERPGRSQGCRGSARRWGSSRGGR